MKLRSTLALSLVSGACFATAFLSSHFWPLGFVGFVLFLHLLKELKSIYIAFILSWLVGFIASGASIVWFWNTYPIAELGGTSAVTQYVFIGFIWLTVSLAMGLGKAVFGLLTHKFFFKLPVVIPVLWVICEWLGSIFFSTYSLGAGGSINGAFSFSYSGYLLARAHAFLVGYAHLGGVYVLSFVFAAIGLCMFLLLTECQSSTKRLAVLFLIFLVLLPYAQKPVISAELPGLELQVVVIETHIQRKGETDRDSLRLALEEATKLEPDFIIAPEDVAIQRAFTDDAALLGLLQGTSTVFIDSYSRSNADNTTTLMASVYESGATEVVEYSKNYLVPQGEFSPYSTDWVFKRFLSPESYGKLAERLSYRPSLEEAQMELRSDIPGILFCFESVKPNAVRQLLSESNTQPPFIAHIVSHGWFNDPRSLEPQLDVMLQVQAVWNDIPIVVAPNMAEAKLYLPNGEVEYGTELQSGGGWRLVQFTI